MGTCFGVRKSVFVKPDLSKEERDECRLLVQDLKQKRTPELNKRHYIRGGAVHSEDVKPKKVNLTTLDVIIVWISTVL